MSLFPLAPAEFNINIKSDVTEKKSGKNKTIKKQPSKERVNAVINKIHENTHNDVEDNDLSDFVPPPTPESAGVERATARSGDERETFEINSDDESVTLKNFNEINVPQTGSDTPYFQNNVPYYTQMSEQPISNPIELMKKMDKILYLLEEQQDHKTGHVTEELVLYSFVGVFLIFIVDSFARAGKYVR